MVDLSRTAERRKRYSEIAQALKKDRTTFDPVWRDLADYIWPRRVRFYTADKNRGERRDKKIIDSTASMAARTLESGMHAGISSPARPWLRLTTPDPELNKYGPVKSFLGELTQRMLTIFARSNLYKGLPTLYGDQGVFATGCMGLFPYEPTLFRAFNYPVGSYWLAVNDQWKVDTFYQETELTVRQVVEAYAVIPGTRKIDWANISRYVKNAWDKHDYQSPVTVCWIVRPNEEYDQAGMGARFKPWISCHWDQGDEDNNLLRESGYDEFPIIAPRWEVVGGDAYGVSCPGIMALGDIKQLQFGEKKAAKALDKQIDPPLQAPPALQNQLISTLPGATTFVEQSGAQAIKAIHDVQLRFDYLEAKQGAVRGRINECFYKDMLLMITEAEDRQRTATEIAERHEEKLIAFGPVLEQQHGEALEPTVERAFGMMLRGNLVPNVPQELRGVPLRVEYISLLAQAQKLVGLSAQERFITDTIGMLPAWPEARHKVRAFKAIDVLADITGVDPDVVVPDDEAQQAAQQEAQQQQAAQQAQNLATAGSGVRDLSQVSPEAMQELMAGVGR